MGDTGKLQLRSLSVALVCGMLVASCTLANDLTSFEDMRPEQRLTAGSAAIEAACNDTDPEGASAEAALTLATARDRAQAYLDFVDREARQGELSNYIRPQAWQYCLEPGLEGQIHSRVEATVFRIGSDADVSAAIAQRSRYTSRESFCMGAGRYPSDIAARIDASCGTP